MSLVRWNPMREMVSLREAMDRLFEESFVRPFGEWPILGEHWAAPAVDVSEDGDHVIIEAEVPGVKADDIEVAVQQGVLYIRGEFREEEERKSKSYHRRERCIGRFERALSLPSSVNPDTARAEFKDGILTLTFDKLEEVKPKRIEIKVKK